jgi:hypothetical protein
MSLLFSMALVASTGLASEGEAEAAAALTKAGAQVVIDRMLPGHPVTEVRFALRQHDDELLNHVAACKQVRKVFIAGLTDFTDDGLKHLKGLRKLEFADLLHPSFTDEGVAYLVECPKLRWLNLSNTAVSDAVGAHLAKIKSLETLSLNMTGVSNKLVGQLTALPNLADLQLTGTKVDDGVWAELANVKKLRFVAVGGTRATPAAAERFKAEHPGVIVGGFERR